MRRSRWTHNKPCEVLSLQSLVDSCHQGIHCSSSPHSPRYGFVRNVPSHFSFEIRWKSVRALPAETWQPACSRCRPIIPCYEKHWRSWYRNHNASESSEINSFFEKLTSELWVREAKFSWAHYRIVCTKLSVDLHTSPWEVIHKWLRYRYRCEHTLRFDAAGRNWTDHDPFKMIYDIWYYIDTYSVSNDVLVGHCCKSFWRLQHLGPWPAPSVFQFPRLHSQEPAVGLANSRSIENQLHEKAPKIVLGSSQDACIVRYSWYSCIARISKSLHLLTYVDSLLPDMCCYKETHLHLLTKASKILCVSSVAAFFCDDFWSS